MRKNIDLINILNGICPIVEVDLKDKAREVERLINIEEPKTICLNQHQICEDFLQQARKKILAKKAQAPDTFIVGSLYLYIEGVRCWGNIKEDIILLDYATNSIYIFGSQSKLQDQGLILRDKLLVFADNDKSDNYTFKNKSIFFIKPDRFAKNHQRFFIYYSPTIAFAFVSKKAANGIIQAVLTNDISAIKKLINIILMID